MADPLRVTCAPEIAPWLAGEIESLGLPVVAVERNGVATEGDDADVMRLNLHLRTGLHVLRPLLSCSSPDPDALYRNARGIAWEKLIPADGYVSVVSTVRTPSIDNTMFANLRLKDAIVDRIADRCGRRPDSGPNRDRAVVHLYWWNDSCVISIDTTGEKLADRGYRRQPHSAPMQETLAAAVLLAAGYDGTQTLTVPMCGSGTLAIEGALIAAHRAPGLLRSNFAFKHLIGFEDDAWRAARRKAKSQAARTEPPRIVATDIDEKAIEAAQANAQTAGVEHLIDFMTCDFAETWVPEQPGIVVVNPEYGLRLGEEEKLEATYARLGDFFKQSCGRHTGYVFTGNRSLAKHIGLRPKRKVPFFNADLECRLLEFELY